MLLASYENGTMVDLFYLHWPVDQDGYETEPGGDHDADGYRYEGGFERLRPRGGPQRFYRPLDDAGLWLRFGETSRDREGVLQFVGEFGMLRQQNDSFGHYQRLAARLWAIHEQLQAGNRLSAANIFTDRSIPLPQMFETILWSANRPEAFEPVVVPYMLEDALKHQALEAITGNRRFRRCRNQGCANWFRLGPRTVTEGRRQTFTMRRAFCSDRCRVAHARRQRKEPTVHA
jgi:hypothetical protein